MDTTKITKFIYETHIFSETIVKIIDSFEYPIVPNKLPLIKTILNSFTEEAKSIDISLLLSKEEMELFENDTRGMKRYASKLFMTAMWIANAEQLTDNLEVIREYYLNLTSITFNFLKKIHPSILTGDLQVYTMNPEFIRPNSRLDELLIRINNKSSSMLKITNCIKESNLHEYLVTILDLIKIEQSTSLQDIAQWISSHKYSIFKKQFDSLIAAYGLDIFQDFIVSCWGPKEYHRCIEKIKTYYQIFPMFFFTFLRQQYPDIITGKFTDYCS
jgi:hypothetical protein